MTDYALRLSPAEVARYQHMARAALDSESETFAKVGIGPGAVVADVGCGPGALAVELARLVGESGRVLAVDRDPAALAVAEDLARQAAVTNLHLSEGEATATGIAPGTVDLVMLRHVLAHNGGREQAIVDHLATLVRPGGVVYLLDIDATAMRMHPRAVAPDATDLADRYLRFQTDRGNDLSVGLRLAELLDRAGLDVVDHIGTYRIMRPVPGMRPPAWAARQEMLAGGVADEADIARWERAFTAFDRGEVDATMFMPFFIGLGRRPA